MKHAAKTDIAVLMLFFNRPETLRQVFRQVKEARPRRLLLFQDGARGEHDLKGMEECRRVVADEEIDWECTVSRNYQERNLGCMVAGFTSHRWAFSLEEKVMVLEDDVVPSLSFFPFCKEMLDRYEHDERITMVAGYNVDEVSTEVRADYFFTSAFSIWGWASWRRVVEQWDEHYTFLDDEEAVRQLSSLIEQRGYRKSFLRMCRDHRDSGQPQFESIFWASMMLNSGLAVMPRVNMISNVGISEDSTHYSALKTQPRRLRQLLTMPRHELSFPLSHPRYVVEEAGYWKRMYKANAWGYPLIKVGRSLEELALNVRYGRWAFIWKSLKRRIRIATGREKFK